LLLAIDIGNTNIKLGIFEDKKLVTTWHVASSVNRLPDEYAAIFLSLLQNKGLKTSDITASCISSVVSPLSSTFEDILGRYFNIKPLVVGAGTKTGVRIRYENPAELGADRIVQAAAAHKLYGGPLIILDMGTATVFDTVNKEGDYLGGALAPGIYIAAEALVARAHSLPRVKLVRPKKAIGSNTISAMQSGIIFGYVGLIEGVVARIWNELGDKGKVVATGGYADLIARETKVIDIINPDLILTGLRLIYDMNKG
jgi:type III pantothenate kinase